MNSITKSAWVLCAGLAAALACGTAKAEVNVAPSPELLGLTETLIAEAALGGRSQQAADRPNCANGGNIERPQTICKLGGERDPPFRASVNTNVELSDGEVYELSGKVIYFKGYPFLSVDLCEHPWLANKWRRNFPVYPFLETTEHSVPSTATTNQTVRTLVIARGQLVTGPGGSPTYMIFLEPIAVRQAR